MTTANYHERYTGIRAMLARLDPAQLAAAIGTGELDQIMAATRDAHADLRHVAQTLHDGDPGRFRPDPVSSAGQANIDDMLARVLAAMGEGRWRFCSHMRTQPAQPAVVALPVRRVDCRPCASTVRKPPMDDSDRCDLCGSRGNVTFWPVGCALANWIVLGDMCRSCADAILPLVGGTTP
jgi:hypothetical protein